MQQQKHNTQPKYTTLKRALVFSTSLLTRASYAATLGAFAITKKYLADDIHVEEGFLGKPLYT